MEDNTMVLELPEMTAEEIDYLEQEYLDEIHRGWSQFDDRRYW